VKLTLIAGIPRGDAPATESELGPCAAVVLDEIAARAYFPHKPRENTEKQI